MWGTGTVFGGRYRLLRHLGSGSMGEVWLAEDPVLERRVAIKVLIPALLDDPGFAERFRAEARTLARLAHPNVVAVHDFGDGSHGGRPVAYLVMEYVEGDTLARLLARTGPLDAVAALELAAGVLDALGEAHAAGIVHRDIKPANLMLCEDRVVVTDFGIAAAEEGGGRLTRTSVAMGTVPYQAPEQAARGDVTASADLYALGVVLYECLTGRLPFDGATAFEVTLKHLTETAPPLPDAVPGPVRALVARALAKDRAARWADAAEMAAAAREAAAGLAPGGLSLRATVAAADAAATAAVAAPASTEPKSPQAEAASSNGPAAPATDTGPRTSAARPAKADASPQRPSFIGRRARSVARGMHRHRVMLSSAVALMLITGLSTALAVVAGRPQPTVVGNAAAESPLGGPGQGSAAGANGAAAKGGSQTAQPSSSPSAPSGTTGGSDVAGPPSASPTTTPTTGTPTPKPPAATSTPTGGPYARPPGGTPNGGGPADGTPTTAPPTTQPPNDGDHGGGSPDPDPPHPKPTPTGPVVPPTAVLVSVPTGLALDNAESASDNGTGVGTYTDNGTSAQQWSIKRQDDGYLIRSGPSGFTKALEMNTLPSLWNGATITQIWSNTGTTNQRWDIQEHGTPGRFRLVNKSNGQCLTANGMAVYADVEPCNDTDTQLWTLRPIATVEANPPGETAPQPLSAGDTPSALAATRTEPTR
ncbi:serine/threonine protein kinase [Yinghuangia seranimata]|uniref:serine/threonine protein kinase n=1 Tax=Yinghuangia seranimata TaxID=408067 RepID=UPI00248B9E87|nr:serine/threonine protein kinase [Yinghuangia seranimata]MDI2131533.1 serine/threonine protein kinase [Yinghuangia seranimata]